ncbi:seipin co-factor family protein [Aspergillus saccharolyticus JOP 1030-1]|uniref:Uncharacterized protein n=1 Tax=Aspergillus saccharolyticus JOP 1030-1 TaxID=1450539 RepID=A0A318Z372_9EURO|nr:hypothetical protein BP01DRAFT_394785 [Aspergillus saccharolyticus JOP 1030-1]PYH41715.1 hypothetical protein BP01DRAFT_394785 [Aspergillus saccharolyticus JOP 1030-1]
MTAPGDPDKECSTQAPSITSPRKQKLDQAQSRDQTHTVTSQSPSATTPLGAMKEKATALLPHLKRIATTHPLLATFLLAQIICSGIPLCLVLGGVMMAASVAAAVVAGLAMLVLGPVLVVTFLLGLGVWGWGWALVWFWRKVGRVVRGEEEEGLGVFGVDLSKLVENNSRSEKGAVDKGGNGDQDGSGKVMG